MKSVNLDTRKLLDLNSSPREVGASVLKANHDDIDEGSHIEGNYLTERH